MWSWRDVLPLMLVLALGITFWALIFRLLLGRAWIFYLQSILLKLKAVVVLGLALIGIIMFSLTLITIFFLTSDVACNGNKAIDPDYHCEVTWIWQN